MGASITLTPVPSAVTSGPPGEYTRGEELVIDWTVAATDGVLTTPSALTFTVRSPDGVDTDYVAGTDPEIVDNADGTGTLTLVLDQSSRWIFRCVTDTPTTAAETDVQVERSPFETAVVQVPGDPGVAFEGAVAVVSSGVYQPVLGTEDGQVLSTNTSGAGFSWEKRRFWILPDVDPTGAVDASVAINAALASRPGACVYLPDGFPRITSPIVWPAANGVTLMGQGTSDRSVLQIDTATRPAIQIADVQHPSIRDLMIQSRRAQESGATVSLSGCFQPTIENVRFDKCADPIWAVSCTETWLWDVMSADSFGSFGILYYGTAGATANAMKLRGGSHAINYPYAVTSTGDWATATAYVQGDVRWAGGRIWQCSTAGTSGATGPTALPSTDSTTARTLEVDDGTAKWRFVCQGAYTHIAQGPYSAALNAHQCSFVFGVFGFRVYDDVVLSGSDPIISFMSEVEFDHQYDTAVRLERGSGHSLSHCWISSVLTQYGVDVQSTFDSNWKLHNVEIFGCAKDGILASRGRGRVTSCNIGNNSQSGTGNYDGIRTAAAITHFVFNDNTSGVLDGGAATQRYGINVVTGASDHYSIQGNLVADNATGGVNDGGSGVNKTVAGNPV